MSDFRTVGFIGLGAMGLPMAEQLATKLPAESRLCVYDVNAAAMDDLARRCSSLGRGVDTGESPRDVASQSVSYLATCLACCGLLMQMAGRHHLDGP